MLPTVGDLYRTMDEIAPFESAEEWDNVGLLTGRSDARVQGALLALDLTAGAIAEAQRKGANLILTHHPTFFHARKNLNEAEPEAEILCALVRANMAHIAAHTNLDRASGGVNDALLAALGITQNIARHKAGYLLAGDIERATPLCELAESVETKLGGRARVYGDRAARVRRVAVCGGAGGEFWREAAEMDADVYITGEVRHHEALNASHIGLCVVEAGHYETERPVLAALGAALQETARLLQWEIPIFVSEYEPFGA